MDSIEDITYDDSSDDGDTAQDSFSVFTSNPKSFREQKVLTTHDVYTMMEASIQQVCDVTDVSKC